MKEYIIQNILNNKRIIKVFIFCFLLGLALGVLSFKFLDEGVIKELILGFKNTIDLSLKNNFDNVRIVTNGFNNVIFINLVFFITTFIFFAPLIFCIIFVIKGMSIGILINVIFNIFNYNDALIAIILIVIIPNLFYLILMIYNGIKCVDCYYSMTNKFDKKDIIKSVYKLSFSFLFTLPFYFLTIVIEQLLFPVVLYIYK